MGNNMAESKQSSHERPIEEAAQSRDSVIVRTSMIGILVNLLLAAFKAVIGLLTHSIAVVLDAVNNTSDALSSVITIIGTKLAGRRPDKKHPLGHGRTEYLSAMLVSALVLYAGITSFEKKKKKIIHPEKANYSVLSLVIIAAAVAAKLILGQYVKAKGKQVNSGSLTASGEDALFDAMLSASVLVSAVLFLTTGLSLEAYVGVVISLMIIKSGIELMSESLDDIIGHRPDREITQKVKEILTQEENVRGAFDLFMNDYGPDRYYASVHLELPDTMTVSEVDRLTRRVQANVFRGTGVVLTGVSVYSYNTMDKDAARIRNEIQEKISKHDWVLQMHGFYIDTVRRDLRFDVVMSFDVDPREGLLKVCSEVQEMYPDYKVTVTPDVDLAD